MELPNTKEQPFGPKYLIYGEKKVHEPTLAAIEKSTNLTAQELFGNKNHKVLILGRKDQGLGIADEPRITVVETDFVSDDLAKDIIDIESRFKKLVKGPEGAYVSFSKLNNNENKDIAHINDILIDLDGNVKSSLSIFLYSRRREQEPEYIDKFELVKQNTDRLLKLIDKVDLKGLSEAERLYINKVSEAVHSIVISVNEINVGKKIRTEIEEYDCVLKKKGFSNTQIFQKEEIMKRSLIQKYLGEKNTLSSSPVSALISELPFENNSFDRLVVPGALTQKILHNMTVDNFEEMFTEIVRVVSEDGEALIFPIQNSNDNSLRFNKETLIGVLERMVVASEGKVSWEILNSNENTLDEVLRIKKSSTSDSIQLEKSRKYLSNIVKENKTITLSLSDWFLKDVSNLFDEGAFVVTTDGTLITRCLINPHLLEDDNPIVLVSPDPIRQKEIGLYALHDEVYKDLVKKANEPGENTRKSLMDRQIFRDFTEGFIELIPEENGSFRGKYRIALKYYYGDLPRVFSDQRFLQKLNQMYHIEVVGDTMTDTDILRIVREANVMDEIEARVDKLRNFVTPHNLNTYRLLAKRLYIENSLVVGSQAWEKVVEMEKLIQ